MKPCLAVLSCCFFIACSQKAPTPGPVPPVSGTTKASVTVAPPPPKAVTAEDLVDTLLDPVKSPNARRAIQAGFIDTQNRICDAAFIFAMWASKRLSWKDFYVEDDETTIAKVMKDSDESRGKRMCYGGQIVQILVNKTKHGKIAEGLLVTGDMKFLSFLAVGSTGDLVERSRGRLCGVVIGRYSYANSAGGTTHSVQVVGMFDLPENTGKKGR
jgi:hypothetical protein